MPLGGGGRGVGLVMVTLAVRAKVHIMVTTDDLDYVQYHNLYRNVFSFHNEVFFCYYLYFLVSNGVCQSEVLSPKLFAIYIYDLSEDLG